MNTNNESSTVKVNQIKENYRQVVASIIQIAESVDRNPEDIRLVVVTKGQPLERVLAVVQAGAHSLGENYVEEALEKMSTLERQEDLEWHMIGHIQSRKSRAVCENFHWVHSVDSVKIARRLNQHAAERGRRLSVLLECNVSGEARKFGWQAWDESRWSNLGDEISPLLELEHLEIKGLMTIPPFSVEPEDSRPYFLRLRRLRDFLVSWYPQLDLRELSMGMSADYQIAIQEGATMVRIGTAILGERVS
jgi:hypothetical protein